MTEAMRVPHPYFERGVVFSDPLTFDDPIPKLTMIPARITTPKIRLDTIDEQGKPSPVDELIAKVNAETERMRRLLPPAPSGMRWTGELQVQESVLDFTRNRGTIEARLVYRLEKLP